MIQMMKFDMYLCNALEVVMIRNRIPLKMLKRTPREKNKNASNKKDKDKKTPIVDGTFTKNIVFKEILTP